MFLRRYTRKKAGKTHSYFALVESVRTDAGPRQRVVAHLGELNSDQELRWQRTVTFHNRQGETQELRLFPDDDPIPRNDPNAAHIRLDSVGWTNARSFGDVYLARWLWNMLGLDAIIDRHVPQGKETVRPADIVAIEVINRLCKPCSEFALAEHWYASTALEDLLGVADAVVTKDRLYRTLDGLIKGQLGIENDLKQHLGQLFQLDYELLLYDLTSSYFEGLMGANEMAQRGYSRDQRSDCKQIVLALVVTREGFPLAHETFAGNKQDLQTVQTIVTDIEKRFGKSRRVWVMDRGMISKETLAFFEEGESDRRYVLGTRRGELAKFQEDLTAVGWQRLPDNPEVEVKQLQRDGLHYLLARSRPRRAKERAMRRRQRRALALGLKKLRERVAKGRLKNRDKIMECVGRLKGKSPKGVPFLIVSVSESRPAADPADGANPTESQTANETAGKKRKKKRSDIVLSLNVSWNVAKFKEALVRDGAYLLRANQAGWTPQEFWETYMQLTVVERAFRVLKSELLLRPIWHHYSHRAEAHVFVCVLAYALWKTLDHLAKRSGLMTLIRKPDETNPEGDPKPRPMTPEVILRELSKLMIGDIELETITGQKLVLRRVARPTGEQKRILDALNLELPERLSSDRLL